MHFKSFNRFSFLPLQNSIPFPIPMMINSPLSHSPFLPRESFYLHRRFVLREVLPAHKISVLPNLRLSFYGFKFLLIISSDLQWLALMLLSLLFAFSSIHLLSTSDDNDDVVIAASFFFLFFMFCYLICVSYWSIDVFWIIFRSSTSLLMRILKVVGLCLRRMIIVVSIYYLYLHQREDKFFCCCPMRFDVYVVFMQIVVLILGNNFLK